MSNDVSSMLFAEIELLSRRDPEAALVRLKQNELVLTTDDTHRTNYSALLINIGGDLKRSDLISNGVLMLEEVTAGDDASESYFFHALFNLGNGHHLLAELERNSSIVPPDVERFQLAKRAYRRAIRISVPIIGRQMSALYTNYANTLSACGRHFDALLEYDKAIQADPTHSLAIGNKGIELSRYASLSGSHSGALHAEAFELLSTAAEDVSLDASGFGKARKMFGTARDEFLPHIEHFRQHLEEEKAFRRNPEEQSGIEGELHNFAGKHDLFINLCVHEWECRDCHQDSLFFDYVTDMGDFETFPRLARYFNQIKEDYVTARYVLFLSQRGDEERSRISGWTSYADLLEYADYGLTGGLAKVAIAQAFNVLDKIAVFLSLEIGIRESEKDIYFASLWRHKNSTTLRPEIRDKDDVNLVALYDLSLDLKDRHLSQLVELRRRITHRHIVSHGFMMYVGDGSLEDDHILYEELIAQGIIALKTVKSAIVYLAAYLNKQYRNQISDGTLRMPMPVLWQEVNQ